MPRPEGRKSNSSRKGFERLDEALEDPEPPNDDALLSYAEKQMKAEMVSLKASLKRAQGINEVLKNKARNNIDRAKNRSI